MMLRTTTGKAGQLPEFGEQISSTICRGPLQEAIDEIIRGIQLPPAMAIMPALSAAAFSLQSWTLVELPDGRKMRPSLFCLAIGRPGEGKSGAVNVAFGPIHDWIGQQEREIQAAEVTYQAKMHIWEARRKALLRESVKSPDDESIEEAYCRHVAEEPQKKQLGAKIVGDITPEAFLSIAQEQNLDSIASVSGEAGEVFSSLSTKTQTMYNNLWSGDPVQSDRKGAGEIKINPALTMYLSPQPAVMKTYLDTAGRNGRGNGFFSRFMFSFPESTQGRRDVHARAATPPDSYREMLKEGMQRTMEASQSAKFEKTTTRLSHEASERLLAVKESIQLEINPGGRFYGFEDHAAKLTDNIARTAMILHCCEHYPGGEISLNTLNSAIRLCFRFSDDFVRYFAVKSQEDIDADALYGFLEKRYLMGVRYVKKNHVMQFGPNRLRNAERLGLAIHMLSNRGLIAVKQPDKAIVIDLHPSELDNREKYLFDIPTS